MFFRSDSPDLSKMEEKMFAKITESQISRAIVREFIKWFDDYIVSDVITTPEKIKNKKKRCAKKHFQSVCLKVQLFCSNKLIRP